MLCLPYEAGSFLQAHLYLPFSLLTVVEYVHYKLQLLTTLLQ